MTLRCSGPIQSGRERSARVDGEMRAKRRSAIRPTNQRTDPTSRPIVARALSVTKSLPSRCCPVLSVLVVLMDSRPTVAGVTWHVARQNLHIGSTTSILQVLLPRFPSHCVAPALAIHPPCSHHAPIQPVLHECNLALSPRHLGGQGAVSQRSGWQGDAAVKCKDDRRNWHPPVGRFFFCDCSS